MTKISKELFLQNAEVLKKIRKVILKTQGKQIKGYNMKGIKAKCYKMNRRKMKMTDMTVERKRADEVVESSIGIKTF